MLSRVVVRSLRAPAFRAQPAPFRIASSAQSRTYAKVGKPKPTQPISQQKIDQKATPKAAKSDPEFTSEQVEFDTKASPEANAPPAAEEKASNAPSQSKSVKEEQVEFDTQAAPAENAPQNDAAESEPKQPFKLPDMRGGLPSTLEFETTGSSAKESAESTLKALNLTEDPTKEPHGEGKRPKGELPASAYVSSSEKKRARTANYMYGAFFLASIGTVIYLGRDWDFEEEKNQHPDAPSGWSPTAMWKRFRARTGDQLSYYTEPAFEKLLPDVDPSFERPYTLVLSLEDLLIHNEWSREHGWRLAKRPGVDYFLRYLSYYYEIVVFTSVPWAVAEPVIKKLDPYHIITWPLYREAAKYREGEYVKDLSFLNRDLSKVIIIDTKEEHVKAQPENAIVLPKWKGDANDKELISLIPFLEYIPTMQVQDVRKAIGSFNGKHIPTEFAAREAIARKKFQEQIAEQQKKRSSRGGLSFLNSALGIKPQAAFEGEQSASEAFAQGKMLQDQARERGQKAYEHLEKMIREQGAKWLAEEKAHEEMAKQEGMKAMKSGFTGFFGLGGEGQEKK